MKFFFKRETPVTVSAVKSNVSGDNDIKLRLRLKRKSGFSSQTFSKHTEETLCCCSFDVVFYVGETFSDQIPEDKASVVLL